MKRADFSKSAVPVLSGGRIEDRPAYRRLLQERRDGNRRNTSVMQGDDELNEPVGLGVLGVGRMGQFHCQLIRDTPGLRLIAASSGAPELTEAAALKFEILTYNDHNELLGNPEIQWVVVATTTDKHREWALKAINARKNLIVEKPMALSVEDAEEIFSAADRAVVRVTVYQSRRWDEDFKLVRRAFEDDLLAEIYRLESRYTDFNAGWGAWGAQGEANPWRLKSEHGGGLLNDWGPHLFDQLFLLIDSKVTGVYGKTYKKNLEHRGGGSFLGGGDL